MKRYAAAVAAVFRDPFNVATAVVAVAVAVVLFAWAGQVVTRFAVGGLYWDLEPRRVAVILALGGSFGLAVPLVVESWRTRRRGAVGQRSGLGLLAGGFGGIACISCCSPLLLPAVGGLLGVSGTTLISANLTAHRWFIPLALASLVVVNGSSALILRDVVRGCRVDAADGVAGSSAVPRDPARAP